MPFFSPDIWILIAIIALLFLTKAVWKKSPVGCLFIAALLIFVVVKSCVEWNEEERKRKERSFDSMNDLLWDMGHDPDSVRLEWLKKKYGDDYYYHMDELEP